MGKCNHKSTFGVNNGASVCCCDCRVYLSLGPARIAAEDRATIAVEIRAAELADLYSSHATSMESNGWASRQIDLTHTLDNGEWLAGYLAHLIWSHDEEQASP